MGAIIELWLRLQEFGVYECYYGLCSGQAQKEIDSDEKRMGPTDRNLMTAKVHGAVCRVCAQ